MRDRPWSREAPAGPWDVIVIGSGMGGMTCAALLAKQGKRVLVLEQHYVPGGFTHTFSRKGYTWDVGVHAVGEVMPEAMPGRLLTALTDGGLKWASLGKTYDEFHFPGEFRIDFPDSPTQFRKNLAAAFPKEGAAIGKYLTLCKQVTRHFMSYAMSRVLPNATSWLTDGFLQRGIKPYLERTTESVINELTQDEKLRALLTAQWGYYGVPPHRSSFAMHALVVKHFLWGGFYPVGGSAQLALTLLGTVAKAGGWTRIVSDVQEILVEKNKTVGVRLKDGTEFKAPVVVSAAGARPTVERLLPTALREKPWAESVAHLKASPAHVCLYVGFRGDIREAGATPANQWFYNTWTHEQEAWPVALGVKPDPARVLYVSFPSLKDPEFKGDKHTAEVVTFVDYDVFAQWKDKRWRRRGDEYETLKKDMEAMLLSQLLERLPKLKPLVEFVELSTPLSTEHFVRPARGSIYGLEPTPERFANKWLRPRTPIDGLYFAGGDMTSVGVIGAMMGGVMGAMAVSPIDVGRYVAHAARAVARHAV